VLALGLRWTVEDEVGAYRDVPLILPVSAHFAFALHRTFVDDYLVFFDHCFLMMIDLSKYEAGVNSPVDPRISLLYAL
jgi:hypothetical protein